MIYVVDAIMGEGKTTAAINYMKENYNKHYLYITPFLDEIDRVQKSLFVNDKKRKFKDPKRIKSKLNDIKQLISKGYNIASSHALFQRFDQEVIDLCSNKNYTLILDEVADVIADYDLTKDDVNLLLKEYVTVDDNHLLHWRKDRDDYCGKFNIEKKLCEMNCLALYGNSIVIWLFPIEVFNAFDDIYILTYMFDSQLQKYYYDYYNIKYNYLYIDNYHFSNIKSITKHDYLDLIHIENSEKLNNIGKNYYDLSKSWFMRNSKNELTKILKNNIYNYFKNKVGEHTDKPLKDDVIWTVYSNYEHKCKPPSYSKSFLPCNARATNNKQYTYAVAYCVNRFVHPAVKNFFLEHNIEIDEDKYALSEMLQFIWRSRIRNGEEIWVYIPSSRMRELLENWINST